MMSTYKARERRTVPPNFFPPFTFEPGVRADTLTWRLHPLTLLVNCSGLSQSTNSYNGQGRGLFLHATTIQEEARRRRRINARRGFRETPDTAAKTGLAGLRELQVCLPSLPLESHRRSLTLAPLPKTQFYQTEEDQVRRMRAYMFSVYYLGLAVHLAADQGQGRTQQAVSASSLTALHT